MNDDFEQQLRSMPRADPSTELDRRIWENFTQTTLTEPAVRRARMGWWLGVMSVAAAMGLLLVLSRRTSDVAELPQHPVVYQIEPRGMLRKWLITPPARLQTPPALIVSIQP